MATVTERRPSWQPTETDRRVRHPLQALRGRIRMYVLIEGIMIAVIFVAAWFWIGMLLDFGAFKAFPIRQNPDQTFSFGGFDWIQNLQWMSPPGQDTAAIVRIVLLCVLVVSLLALVAFKVFMRLFVEFRDTSLALVLERRFPEQLGDRLITAVEMADPKLADKYGLSRAMIEKTIKEAAERVEKLPVGNVFNWRRLRRLTLLALGLTVGLYLLLWGAFVGIAAAMGAADAPIDFFHRFNHVASIWTERNVLVQNSYWPRQTYLEIIRFQDTPAHPDEMRIGLADQQRPDIQVRGVRWVMADSSSPDGWRALRWLDLPKLGDDELTKRAAAVDFADDWAAWVIDLSDLKDGVPSGILPATWQNKTSGEIRTAMEQPEFRDTIASLGKQKEVVQKAATELLNWKSWTVDKIELQEDKGEVRRAMMDQKLSAHKALQDVIRRLEELTDAVYMDRIIRQLEVPENVEVYYHGKKTKSSSPYDRIADRKYTVGLGELSESVEFTVRGNDFYTRPRKITLVPPPSILSLTVYKEEPAYIYYRVQGDQTQLKNKKQIFKNVSISISGDSSVVQVPFGTNMVLTAQSDRDLKPGILIRKSDKAKANANVPLVEVMQQDKRTFETTFNNVDRLYDFQFEFIDEDNVKGKRRVIIEPVDDKAPDVTLELDPQVVLRKAAQQKGPRNADADGYLVTPDALIPFKGMIRDDYALTDAKWLYETKQVDIELGSKTPSRQSDELSLIISGMQYNPIHRGLAGTAVYWTWLTSVLKANTALTKPAVEEVTPLVEFRQRLLGVEEVPVTALDDLLKAKLKRKPMLREHNVKDETGFDFRTFLPRIKVNDASREAQLHYQVKVYVTALDNNVETGPSPSLKPKATTFLVVSENELLTQIFIEEETIREQLEKVIHQLQDARTRVEEQVTALTTPGPKMSLVAIQVSEAQKVASNAASRTREVHRNYSRILTELKVNRVKQQKIDSVEFDIVRPLGIIVDPNAEPKDGNFATTEDSLAQFYQGVNNDASVIDGYKEGESVPSTVLDKIEKNRPAHLQSAQNTRNHIDRLIAALKVVLDNMEEGITEARLVALLVGIERDQRETYLRLNRFHDEEVRRILEALTGGTEKK